jgi:hypothetical protein
MCPRLRIGAGAVANGQLTPAEGENFPLLMGVAHADDPRNWRSASVP